MNNFRKINTPFFSKKAYEILNSVHIQLCSGLWENCRVYTKHWVNFNIGRRANGQVYFKVNKNHRTNVFGGEKLYDNPFIDMSNVQFLNWVAIKLKDVITAELKENSISLKEGWKRDNTTLESEYLSCNENITIAEIYVIYDWLKGHKIDMSLSIVKDIFGNPRSKEQIKKIKDKQSEIDFIQANRDNLVEEVKEKYNYYIADLEDRIAKLKEKMEAELEDINDVCNANVKALREELKELDR